MIATASEYHISDRYKMIFMAYQLLRMMAPNPLSLSSAPMSLDFYLLSLLFTSTAIVCGFAELVTVAD